MENRIIEVVIEKITTVGLNGFIVDDISDELAISKKTIYNYFSSKREIIKAAIHKIMTEETEWIEHKYQSTENSIEQLRFILTSFSWTDEIDGLSLELKRYYPEVYQEEFKPHRDYRKQLFIDVIQSIYQEYDVEHKIDINLLVAIVESFVAQVDLSFFRENDLTQQQILEDLHHLILYGVLGQKSVK